MHEDIPAQQEFSQKWPPLRILAAAVLFAVTVVAMWFHHPVEWFIIPASMAVQECLHDWRTARQRRTAA
jgi:hypothetical protein